MVLRTAIITLSDRGAAGKREDESGKVIREMITGIGASVVHYEILPDEKPLIVGSLTKLAASGNIDIILTTGGTGVSPARCNTRGYPGGDRSRTPRDGRSYAGRKPQKNTTCHDIACCCRHPKPNPDCQPPRQSEGRSREPCSHTSCADSYHRKDQGRSFGMRHSIAALRATA